tara:strand:+ start:1979 stop:2539 length:561 start_codon:yes stop_codon:yes gene_type:complete
VRKKTKVFSSKDIKDITNTIPMMTGIGATAVFNSWSSIENYSKHHGVYTPFQLRELILQHSPLAKIGDTNLEIARIIDEDIAKKDKSFHAACLENFRELCVLIGVDPNTIHMGANWAAVQKKKNKNFTSKKYPKQYTAIIKTLQSRYTRLITSNANTYKTWCVANKKNRDTLDFIKKTLKFLDKKK